MAAGQVGGRPTGDGDMGVRMGYVLLGTWYGLGIWSVVIRRSKGISTSILGLVFCIGLGPLSLLVAWMAEGYKGCYNCKRNIRRRAKTCPHCGVSFAKQTA